MGIPAKSDQEAGRALAPILMRRDEIVNLQKASYLTGKSPDTLRRWNRLYRIARQTSENAPLEFSVIALEMVMHGDLDALEALRAGRRSDPVVRRYIDHLGLPG